MQIDLFGKPVAFIRWSPEHKPLKKHGRVWIDAFDCTTTIEYGVPSKAFGFGVSFDPEESNMTLKARLPPVSLFVVFDGKPFRTVATFIANALSSDMGSCYEDRDFSVSVFDSAIWWHAGVTTMGSSSKTPKWRSGGWYPFGHERLQSEKLVREEAVLVPMPERSYRGTAKLFKTTWGKPGLPRLFDKELMRVSVDMEPGESVPFPGKGENSWDCGQDSLSSSTLPARTIEEAVGSIVGSVLERRRKHGGRDWKPATKAVEGASA